MERLSGLWPGFEIVDVRSASARRSARAYESWGKDAHPATLNFGDCLAYEVAKQYGRRLLHVGEDFKKTDIETML
jgi:ribonuclease VapC